MAKWKEGDRGAAPRTGGARGRGARVLTEKQLVPYDHHLGVVSDSRVAKMAGLSTATIARIRRSRGIAAAPRARQPQTPDGTDAFRVTTAEGERWVLLASSLLEASEEAAGRGLEAVEVEWLGALIR